ncbi:MAG: response regulator, partial [Deltaproteobacteria bacterium]|nr:response regulator [Deltaproteobacteria bacterium]
MKAPFSSISISRKIGLILLFFIFMMGVGGAVGLYNATKVVGVTETLYESYFGRLDTLSTIEKELMAQRQQLFLHVSVEDEGSKLFLLEGLGSHRDTVEGLMFQYRAFGLSDEAEVLFRKFSDNLMSYWETQHQIIELSSAGDNKKATNMYGEAGKRNFNKAFSIFTKVIEFEKHEGYNAYSRAKELGNIIIVITIVFTVAAILIAIILWGYFTRSITRPIIAIEESAKQMGKGDLRQRAEIFGDDEIGSLAREFNKMAEGLQESYATLEGNVEERTEELRRANEELSDNKEELEAKNQELSKASFMKSQFLANVSHELRTPLNSVIGFSELLQEKAFGDLTEKQEQYVKYINSSGTHLLELINSILDLSKIEAGRMELMEEDFSVVDFLGDIIATVRPMAEKKNVSISTKTVTASPIIKADKGKFKQIMFNLLSNAVKFNDDGGSVTIDWDIKTEPVGMDMKRFFYISVQDTGMGIKSEDIGRLFKEFEQIDPSVTRDHGGTGLGLALTKRLVELHGGEIWAEGELGEGCTFTLKLPHDGEGVDFVAQPEELKKETSLTATGEEGRPLIIISTESADINQLIEIYLSEDHFDVKVVNDGSKLLETAKNLQPFAIIMGIAIPGKDGWEVLGELKESKYTMDIPVIIVSATNNKELGFAQGAVDYLVKPVDKSKILATLSRLDFKAKALSEPMNILVVDDEPQIIELLKDILEGEGFKVMSADGGRAAIEKAVDTVPDLIVLDLMMPEVSGFDVVSALRKNPITMAIPVIVFTAKDITKEDKKKLESNIESIVQKS